MSSTSRRGTTVMALAIMLGTIVGMAPAASAAPGKPLPAQITFNVSTYEFGNVTVGQTSSSTFTLSNAGGRNAGGLKVGVSGAGMAITANTCGKTLKPASTCSVTVVFGPEGTGAVTGVLTASGRGLSPVTVALTGTGVAPDGRYLYWGDIGRAQLDGTSADPAFVVPANSPSALDVGAGYIYWTYSGSVLRIPADGTGEPEVIVEGASGETHGIALSETHVYWVHYSAKQVWRANLDGTSPEALLTGLDNPWGLDVEDGYVYWSEASGGSTSKIRRVPLSALGSDPEVLYEYPADTTRSPAGLEVGNGRVYWADSDWNDYSGRVLSVPVGGGEVHVDVTLSAPNRVDDVALDTEGGWLYYTVNADDDDEDYFDSSIARRKLDGTGSEETVVPGIRMAYSVAIG